MVRIAVAVVEQQGQFLIGPRAAGGVLPGYWEFPGGKVRPGESPRQAAARECLEETGLEVRVGQVYPHVIHQYAHGTLEVHFFACQPIDSVEARTPFIWVPRSDLAKYEFPPANAELLKTLLATAN